MVVITRSSTDHKVSRGKFCHFQKEDFIRHGLMDYYWKPIDEATALELRDRIVNILLKEKFVFFEGEDVAYKYKTKFGNLMEFAVNFRHID